MDLGKLIPLLLLLSAASAIQIEPADSATEMSSLYWVQADGEDWMATGTVHLLPSAYNYNSTAMEPFFYHQAGKMLTWTGTAIPVFANESNYSKYHALRYISNGSACTFGSGLVNSTGSYPTSCLLMVDRRTGMWVDYEHDLAFISFTGGSTPACELKAMPLGYSLRLVGNTMRYAFSVFGAGWLVDIIIVLVQSAFYLTFLAALISMITVIPKVITR